jgi:hypothetical protein
MTRRLTNQDAFDGAMLHLLNQGRSCLSASGQARYRGPRGKSALGALIPDEVYITSMEGKKLHHLLAARSSEFDALRERLGGVTPSLLDDLQDLHDRSGACMPSLYRHLVLAGAQRIAQSFKLSMRLVIRGASYQHLRGPHVFSAAGNRSIPATAPAIDVSVAPVDAVPVAPVAAVPVAPVAAVSAAPVAAVPVASVAAVPVAPVAATPAAPVVAAPSAPVVEVSAAPASDVSSAPALAAAPTPAPAPLPLPERPQEDELDLIARGIAKAIAAASGPNLDQRSGRR